jgi:chromosome partitioning protein
MRVLVVANQKGGSSKSSSSAHLAVAAESAGAGPVVLLDTDAQGTLTAWWRQREAETPVLAECPLSELPAKLAALRDAGYGLAIIDTPPAVTALIRTVIALADFVLIPVRASPADLWAVGGTLDLCREAGRPYAFLLTQATRGANITTQALGALSEHGLVCGTVIHARVGYAGALTSGQTIQEIDPNGAGAREVREVWNFVQERLMPSTIAKSKAKKGVVV